MTSAFDWRTAPKSICHDIFFKGDRVGTSWAVLRSYPNIPAAAADEVVIECFQRMQDVGAIGLRGYRKHSIYKLSPAGHPREAFVEDSNGNALRFLISKKHLIIGSDKRRLNAPIDFVLENNMFPLAAYLLLLHPPETRHRYNAVIADNAVTLPLEVTASDHGYVTNLGETYSRGDDGVVSEVTLKTPLFHAYRARRRIPRWPSPLASPRFRYVPYKDIKTKETTLTVSGRETEATIARPKKPTQTNTVCVFVGGTGIFNRHGFTSQIDLGYHRLLDGLAIEGIATIRYERFPKGTGDLATAEEAIDFGALCRGAAAWLDWLDGEAWAKGMPKVIIGHSLGGLVALRLSAVRSDLAGAVVLNTPGGTLRNTTAIQHSWFARHMDVPDSSKREAARLRKVFITALETDAEWTDETVPVEILPFKRQRGLLKSILDLDPCGLVGAGSAPLLIVQGQNYIQVPPGDARRLLATARNANRRAKLIEACGLDHLLRRNDAEGLRAIKNYVDRRRRIPIALIRQIAKALKDIAG